jgi:predicted GH43/DUF377 family glycosyl hydrolase
MRVYYQWAVLLDKNNLTPKRISKNPFLSGGKAKGLFPGVIFTTSAIKINNDFYILSGEGNTVISWNKISQDKMSELFVDIV